MCKIKKKLFQNFSEWIFKKTIIFFNLNGFSKSLQLLWDEDTYFGVNFE